MSGDKNTHQELSVSVWYGIKVTAIISVFRQMKKSRLCNLIHNLLFITFHRSRRGAWICVWINILLHEIMHSWWTDVTSFLGPNTTGARGKTPLDSKGLWLRPVLQIMGEILIPISSSPLTSRERELHLVCFFLIHRNVHLTLEKASFIHSRKQGKKSVRLLGRETALRLGGSLDLLKSGTAASDIAQNVSVPSAVHTPVSLN